MTQKSVSWKDGTKSHDGNPNYKIPYEKVTMVVREKYPESISCDLDASRMHEEEDMNWLEYVSPLDDESQRIIILE